MRLLRARAAARLAALHRTGWYWPGSAPTRCRCDHGVEDHHGDRAATSATRRAGPGGGGPPASGSPPAASLRAFLDGRRSPIALSLPTICSACVPARPWVGCTSRPSRSRGGHAADAGALPHTSTRGRSMRPARDRRRFFAVAARSLATWSYCCRRRRYTGSGCGLPHRGRTRRDAVARSSPTRSATTRPGPGAAGGVLRRVLHEWSYPPPPTARCCARRGYTVRDGLIAAKASSRRECGCGRRFEPRYVGSCDTDVRDLCAVRRLRARGRRAPGASFPFHRPLPRDVRASATALFPLGRAFAACQDSTDSFTVDLARVECRTSTRRPAAEETPASRPARRRTATGAVPSGNHAWGAPQASATLPPQR